MRRRRFLRSGKGLAVERRLKKGKQAIVGKAPCGFSARGIFAPKGKET